MTGLFTSIAARLLRISKPHALHWARQLGAVLTTIIVLGLSFTEASATTRSANTEASLTSAITASAASGDTINITADIVVTAAVSLNKSLTITGNDYTISVPQPGLTDAGLINASPSNFRVFTVSGTVSVTIQNLKIKGGYAQGAGITNPTGATVRLDGVTISHGRGMTTAGGIYNSGTFTLNNCRIIRNAAPYGGGFENENGGTMFVNNSTFAENRTETAGGGAGQNYKATLYINNSTFSSNTTMEAGGAINNYMGILWALNSSFTGNVSPLEAGAINTHGSTTLGTPTGYATSYLINNLFAYNYTTDNKTAPTSVTLTDAKVYTNLAGAVYSYYNIYHGTMPVTSGSATYERVGDVAYTGAADGSDNSLTSGGVQTRIINGSGAQIVGSPLIFTPYLISSSGNILPTLKTGSFALNAANRGTKAGLKSDGTVVGYYNKITSAWVDLKSTGASSYEVITDQLGTTRSNPTTRGATEAVVDNVYSLKVLVSTGGSVSGGSLYGDIYASGTQVPLTAFPNASYLFSQWNNEVGTLASTANPYVVTVTANTVVQPIFVAAGSNYTVTYLGNGNTSGSAPAPDTSSASKTISNAATLARTGYAFTNWNTSANGSGTSYAVGATYSTVANLTLYAQWQTAATATTGSASSITTTGAALNGTVNDNGASTTVTFDYGTTSGYGTNVAATTGATVAAGAGSTAVAVMLSGLTCNTTYHVGDRAIADHHATGVNAHMSGKVLDLVRQVDHRLRDVFGLLAPGILLTLGEAQCPGHIPDRTAPAVGDDVGDLGGIVTAIAGVDVLDDLFTQIRLDIDVNIGRPVAGRRQKPFEEKAIGHRVDGGDAERIADRRVGRRSTALTQNIATAAEPGDVMHHQEVAGKVESGDDVEFPFDLRVGHRRAGPRPVPIGRSDHDQLAQPAVLGVILGGLEGREFRGDQRQFK